MRVPVPFLLDRDTIVRGDKADFLRVQAWNRNGEELFQEFGVLEFLPAMSAWDLVRPRVGRDLVAAQLARWEREVGDEERLVKVLRHAREDDA